ncbi:MAG: DUF4062 domain-containing protein [Planctomycetes bacterium]|nr:DUF4062 domain-containing protein [Planctomycetota bacterium]
MRGVFVSSTHRKNQARRQALADVIEELGLEVIWSEGFLATGTPILDTCLEKVRTCDVFKKGTSWLCAIFRWRKSWGSGFASAVGSGAGVAMRAHASRNSFSPSNGTQCVARSSSPRVPSGGSSIRSSR